MSSINTGSGVDSMEVQVPVHVHTATCHRERLSCALHKIGELEDALFRARTALREVGGAVDKIEAEIDKLVPK